MLYPRIARVKKREVLVNDMQMVSYREHLYQRRMLFLSGPITGDMENHDKLMGLDHISDKPITLVITSLGGDLDSALLFYDTMKLIKSPIITIGRYCASAAAFILAAGKKGNRYLIPHAKVVLHLPTGNMGGDARDWDIMHKQMQKYKERIVDILCECGAKKSPAEILADMDRDFWLEPQEAINYGLADAIYTPGIWQEWTRENK